MGSAGGVWSIMSLLLLLDCTTLGISALRAEKHSLRIPYQAFNGHSRSLTMAPEQIHTKFVRLLNQQYLQISVAVLPTTASWGNFTGFWKTPTGRVGRMLLESQFHLPYSLQVHMSFHPRFGLAVAWGVRSQRRQDDEDVKDTLLNRSTGKALGKGVLTRYIYLVSENGSLGVCIVWWFHPSGSIECVCVCVKMPRMIIRYYNIL